MERLNNQHSSSRRCPLSLILPTRKRAITEVHKSAPIRVLKSPNGAISWPAGMLERRSLSCSQNSSLSLADVSNVGAYAEITVMYPTPVRILIDIRRGDTNNGCSTQDRSVLQTAILTACLGFHCSQNCSKIWCNFLLLLIQMNATSFCYGKLTGWRGGPVLG